MDQLAFLKHTVDWLDQIGIPHLVVGSYACLAYGEPRFTQDIDLVIDLKPSQVDAFCSGFPSPEYYISLQAVRDAVRSRFQFNVIHPASGNKIDFLLTNAKEWSRTQLERRRMIRLHPDRDVAIAAPEDVILGKLWYFSEGRSDKHLRDILGILKISGDLVDRDEVSRWAAKLGYTDLWNACLARLAGATT